MNAPDMTSLSRRDRAAILLALTWIRVTPGRGGGPLLAREQACEALRMGGKGAKAIAEAVASANSELASEMARNGDLSSEARYLDVLATNRRLVRARLALFLRTVVRVDDDDYGCWDGDRGGWLPRPYHALWESAPPHRKKVSQ